MALFSVKVGLRGGGIKGEMAVALPRAAQVTTGDLLQLAAEQQSDILQRTERGLDVNGAPFAAYNSTRPYYYYPAGKVGSARLKAQLRSARGRVAKKARGAAGSGVRTRSGLGLRFSSYRVFKQSYLGRSNVDLRGARAPHMLQQIAIQAGGTSVPAGTNPGQFSGLGVDAAATPASRVTLGIYGEAGARAAGHNSEQRPKGMPRRQFFAVNDQELARRTSRLEARITERLSRALGE